jgi:mutator protein MutT
MMCWLRDLKTDNLTPIMAIKRADVAIGIIIRDGLILICQRRAQDPLGGYWEFPGGKQEPGESPDQCLVRELAEELGIEVRLIDALPIIEWDYPAVHVRLHPLVCELTVGEPKPHASEQLRWVKPADLAQYRFPPANDNLIRTLASRFEQSRGG